jgi:hypothetical protein
MTTLMIKDLPLTEELGQQAMASVRGGCSYCPPTYGGSPLYGGSPVYGSPKPYGQPSAVSLDASQMLGQTQNVVNNNGNNAAFVSGISSTVNPTQTGSNNINLGI